MHLQAPAQQSRRRIHTDPPSADESVTFLQPQSTRPAVSSHSQQSHRSHHRRSHANSHANPPFADKGVTFPEPQPIQPVVVSHSQHHKLRRRYSQNSVQAAVQHHNMSAPTSHHRHRRYSHDLVQAPAIHQHKSKTPAPAPNPRQHPAFRYSKCTGRRKALCVTVCVAR